MKWGVVVFPGSCDERDAAYALGSVVGDDVVMLWHGDADTKGVDAVVLPGGFSFGDYLRCGAMARFSPVMRAVTEHARAGGPVFGICNGFQILCEAGLLPGVLMRNASLKFVCRDVLVRVEGGETPVSRGLLGQEIRMPVAHAEGNYFADPETLARLEGEGRVAFRYVGGAPNGSTHDIAGVSGGLRGNVVGLMPHPERASEGILGGEGGRRLFEALLGR